MSHWTEDAIFYHIYPLGLCGAPPANDFHTPPVHRLEQVCGWLDHLRNLGVNALYLGPVFEASAHGYDTADYFQVDRRLGDRSTLARLSQDLHRRGMRLVLDGVFNHVGRDFWAFCDVRDRLDRSAYLDWFQGLRFDTRSPYGDPFTYDTWNGCFDLVKLNTHNPAVRAHLFEAVAMWASEFGIDGLRLDAADSLDMDFQKALAHFCRDLKPDFWLMGEVIHGDYRAWANPAALDAVTNYEVYKGLYSSHVDSNYFEIAYSLNRQFGESGIYTNLALYNFVDNHDVDRAASRLTHPAHLYPLYTLLFTIPGVPSIYYGSEFGLPGRRTASDDRPLRPQLDLVQLSQNSPHPDLPGAIARLARMRSASGALKYGSYRQLHVSAEQLAFWRAWREEHAVVIVNAAEQPAYLDLTVPLEDGLVLTDALDPGGYVKVHQGKITVEVMPHWGRVLMNLPK